MKKAILVGILGIFSFGVYAQVPDKVEEEKSYEYSQDQGEVSVKSKSESTVETDAGTVEVKTQYKEKTGDGKSTIGKAANKVGHGAKEAGKGVKNGAKWTVDKIKHNKVTKEVFNQPGDIDKKNTQAKQEVKVKKEETDVSGKLEESAEKTGDKAEDVVD
ncbi:MAG TPA: hypothetical protein VIK89_14930 [Cytophagaceae bacterium]